MTRQFEEHDWKQHFPTYHFEQRDIALEEYKFATKTLETEERVFLNAVNIAVVLGAALGSLALGSLDKITTAFSPVVPEIAALIFILTLAASFAWILLRHFADRQKAVVFAARKVIVLRRMLGMSYGKLQLVLPNWRIEGADEPLAVRMFPGWNTYVTYPCFAIAGISSAVSFFVLAALLREFEKAGTTLPFHLGFLIAAALAWFVVLCWTYRKALFDTHERSSLLAARCFAGALRLRLVPNIEYVLYRATLAKHELHRLGIELSPIKRMLIHIEDKEFYSHSGISVRGMARLMMHIFGRRRRSGGSTITQQVVRSLFIEDQTKLVRRKMVEIILALWFDNVVSKTDQVETYLASVRFESGVLGLAAAMRHFFGALKKSISQAEAFFLVERISNIRSKLLLEKVDQTARGVIKAGLLCPDDLQQLIELYACAIREGKIQDSEGSAIHRLRKAWGCPSSGDEAKALA